MDKPADSTALRDALATVRRQMARPTASPAASLEYEAYTEACEPVAREFVRLLDAGELVRVKELRWDERYKFASADIPMGDIACVQMIGGKWQWRVDIADNDSKSGPCRDMKDGKARAEKYWRFRLAAALEPLISTET